MSQKPFVSVLTPTYNRRAFIPALIACYKAQTYPKDRMEWIVLDDGQESVADLFEEAKKWIPNLTYIREEEKLLIGAKRNRLNQTAKGEICVAMDDDDYYPPERVAHCVQKFQQNPTYDLAGSSEMYMYDSAYKLIVRLGPYGAKHCTNGTLAYRSSYGKTHKYDEFVTHSEEKSFLDNYKHPMIQMDPFKTILVMSHNSNTFDKKQFLGEDNKNPFVKKTAMKLKDFIKDPTLRAFYATS
jgi:glycosyltransferase involved in cell wall biosynthesis